MNIIFIITADKNIKLNITFPLENIKIIEELNCQNNCCYLGITLLLQQLNEKTHRNSKNDMETIEEIILQSWAE